MAVEVPVPTYAFGDETAIKVVDGIVEVISEGHWKLFSANQELSEEEWQCGSTSMPTPGNYRCCWARVAYPVLRFNSRDLSIFISAFP
jgi:hypothetical protein